MSLWPFMSGTRCLSELSVNLIRRKIPPKKDLRDFLVLLLFISSTAANRSCLGKCPTRFIFLFIITFIIALTSPSTVSFVLCSIRFVPIIFLYISIASILTCILHLSVVHVSPLYNTYTPNVCLYKFLFGSCARMCIRKKFSIHLIVVYISNETIKFV